MPSNQDKKQIKEESLDQDQVLLPHNSTKKRGKKGGESLLAKKVKTIKAQ